MNILETSELKREKNSKEYASNFLRPDTEGHTPKDSKPTKKKKKAHIDAHGADLDSTAAKSNIINYHKKYRLKLYYYYLKY